MQVKLKILHGLNAGREIDVAAPEFVVGRQAIRDLCPVTAFVSRCHCNILVRDDQVTVLDLDSRNGTFVNSELVKDEQVLEMGDVLRIGHVELEVLIECSSACCERSKVSELLSRLRTLLAKHTSAHVPL